MATRPDAYPYQRRLTDFDTIVRSAQRTLESQINNALRSGDLQSAQGRRLQLAAVNATLEQMGAAIVPLSRQLVQEAWTQGGERAAIQVAQLEINAPEIPGAFTGVSRQAVEAMQASIEGRLTDTQQTIGRRIEDVYAREQRRASLRAILGAEGSPQAASKRMQLRLLQDRHIAQAVRDGNTGFVDKAGRRWKLDTYANMATRTITREAVVQGSIARMASHGIALARVSTHASSCAICKPFEGTLVSLDGSVTEYDGQAVGDLSTVPPFHGSCEHSLEPLSVLVDALRRELAVGGVA